MAKLVAALIWACGFLFVCLSIFGLALQLAFWLLVASFMLIIAVMALSKEDGPGD